MPSVRKQIFDAVEAKLDLVLTDLGWATRLTNPREPFGEDQMNAIALMHGGDREPEGLTGNVEQRWLELSVGWVVIEATEGEAEDLLDAGLVAISDALLDPTDVQLSGLAVAIRLEGISDPMIGRSQSGSRIIAGQSMDFRVQYLAREGDASSPGP